MHTYIHTCIYAYIHIYIYVCVYVCVREHVLKYVSLIRIADIFVKEYMRVFVYYTHIDVYYICI